MQDFYWKRNGLRWEVWHQDGDSHNRLCWFFRERTAAMVCNLVFSAYGHGRDVQRARQS